ncbi:MAG TPA: hypothetical protein VGP36_07310 [Mycobacteriales bacterium]|nr:hypothetical protein [Mycobacteriales bacterium]
MARTITVLLVLAAIAGGSVAAAGPAAAAGPNCRVQNAALGASYGPDTGVALSTAIAAARAGDRLVVSGTCTGNYDVTTDLTIAGLHPGARRPVLDGGGAGSVLLVDFATVTLTDVVVTHGQTGIDNFGTLKATRLLVRDNTTVGSGGGILNSGFLTLVRSTVAGNRSTLNDGGGIWNNGTLVTWSTRISGNTAANAGGGLLNEEIAVLHGSTITGNTATFGGGIFATFGGSSIPTLDHTTVTGNHPDDCAPAC